jgi:tRNA pseudouridine38-40 synthase
MQRALNSVLPEDVAILTLESAAPGWHPRFSARRRFYRYTVLNRPVRSPLERRYAHLVTEPLDLAALRSAAEPLVGEHDFASFGHPPQGDSTIRVIYTAEWRQEGEWFIFDVVGNAFLRGMVRSLVGTLLQVGRGQWPAVKVSEILRGQDRALAAAPAPACGLCLMKVEYESVGE